jgi:hypothetical protein
VARILVLDGFGISGRRQAVDDGQMPDHMLLGVKHLERAGHTVEVIQTGRSGFWGTVSGAVARVPLPVGDLEQQRRVLRAASQAEALYAPGQARGIGLALLRSLGRFELPTVWLMHHPFDCGRLAWMRRPYMRRALRGIDRYPALTEPVARELRAFGRDNGRTRVLSYGPDPDWYPKPEGLGRGVIAAGNMKRDFETFARAQAQTHVPGWIVCARELEPQSSPGSRTQVLSHESGAGMPLESLLALYAQARAIAIPLRIEWPWTINGLTSLADALGLGKPVIMTRNPLLDMDLEGLGIGITVEPGDVDGWRKAIEHLDQHPEVAAEMGARARALVDDGVCSSRTFGQELVQIFEEVLSNGRRLPNSAVPAS